MKRQGSFWPYDFSVIPIETISAIYEHFLKAEDEGPTEIRRILHATLSEMILDIALEGIGACSTSASSTRPAVRGSSWSDSSTAWRKNGNASTRTPSMIDESRFVLISNLVEHLFGLDLTQPHGASRPLVCTSPSSTSFRRLTSKSCNEKAKCFLAWCSLPTKAHLKQPGRRFFAETSSNRQPSSPIGLTWLWVIPPGQASRDRATAETWCEEHGLPIANRQLALGFVWKAANHQRPGGRICFVLPHGVLFNHRDTSIRCQQTWLKRHSVELVLNLADMRFNLFEAAAGPALIIRYRAETPDCRKGHINYFSPKTSWSVSQAEIITIPTEDRTQIRLAEILADLSSDRGTQLWKECFWGTPRDWKLLDRLSTQPSLGQIVATTRERGERGG